MPDEKLKACPFCGKPAMLICHTQEYPDGHSGFRGYRVGCENERCEIQPRTKKVPHSSWCIRYWNRRAPDA